ncbi:MAG: UDP-N-acetylmuramate--L-alanine ligase [Bacteroidales bacterium]|nr:UDP-N-acetylmuramate--L-alanine ligase [Bacteroidales bacterium]
MRTTDLDIRHYDRIYFLGIGGIGMSALALYCLHEGKRVDGYDRVETPLCRQMAACGARIHYLEAPELVPSDTQLVIYTPAIPSDHREWEALRALGVPIYKRAEVLGACTRPYHTLAVAGSHGKTTTSALLAYLLHETGGCCAFLGGVAKNYDRNFLYTAGAAWAVAEADEYDRSFLQLHPRYSIVTAMDADHLDIYGTVENMRAAFAEFMRQTDAQGGVIIKDTWRAYVPDVPVYRTYGLEATPGTQVYARGLRVEDGAYRFDYVSPDYIIQDLRLTYPGRHNVENALAAVTAALAAGVRPEDIRRLLPGFRGVKRRFDIQYRQGGRLYIDDYAHHPDEIAVCLRALRELYPQRSIRVAFQPHLYSRTRDLAAGFAQSLQLADEVVLLDIYPAREKPIPGVTAHSIGDLIKDRPVHYATLQNAVDVLNALPPVPILVTMGAGDIDTLVAPLREGYERAATVKPAMEA